MAPAEAEGKEKAPGLKGTGAEARENFLLLDFRDQHLSF